MLGGLRAKIGELETMRFRTYKTGALLSCLAYNIDKPLPRDELIEMLWPDAGMDQARNSLSQSLSSLRGLLEPPGTSPGSVLEASRHSVRILSEQCTTDVMEFRSLLKSAQSAATRKDEEQWEKFARQAVAMFSGEFLPGYYEDWAIVPREHLREEAVSMIEGLIKLEMERQEWSRALDLVLQCLTIDSTREAVYQQGIRLYDKLDQPDAAVGLYRTCERSLASVLGIKPSEQTRTLAKGVLKKARAEQAGAAPEETEQGFGTPTWASTDAPSSDGRPQGQIRFGSAEAALVFARDTVAKFPRARVALGTHPLPGTVTYVLANFGQVVADEATALLTAGSWNDRGHHKTGTGPARLFLLAECDGPLAAEREMPTGLVLANPFFGREAEFAGVSSLIESRKARLVTLTGHGGIGKTRLSQEVAYKVRDSFPGGVYFVRLEDAHTAQEVWDALATSLGIAVGGKTPIAEQVTTILERGNRLVVLDNFEQLVETGGPAIVAELTKCAPESSFIVSSRRKLNIDGEVEVPLGPLPTVETMTELDILASSPAVALFVDRSRAVRPDFHLSESNKDDVATLCHRLEGIPLALELAAARAQVMTPSQILQKFDQRLDLLASKAKPERHRSIRNAIDWTYSLLSDELREAFRRLSVFRGGWDEEAAEHVLQSPFALDILSDLREFSLISTREDDHGTMRFSMLETLREYGRKASPPDEWTETCKRHAQAFLSECEAAEPLLEGAQQLEVLNRLENDRANIAEAVRWLCTQNDSEQALRICASAWRFWHLKAHLDEGRVLLGEALKLPGGTSLTRAKALNGCGRLCYLQGDYNLAEKHHREAMELAPDDKHVQAMSSNALGAVLYETGDYPEAERLFLKSLELRRELEDDFGIGNSLSWLGIVYTDQSRFQDAKRALEESLVVREKIGDLSGIARSWNSLGIVDRRLGDLASAEAAYLKALEIQRRLGDKRAIAGLLSNLAIVAQADGRYDEARELLQGSQATNQETGDKWGTATVHANLANLALDQNFVEEALQQNLLALRLRSEIGNPWGVAFSLEGAAKALVAAGAVQDAVTAFASAEKIRDAIGSPLPPVERESLEKTMACAKQAMGAKDYAAAMGSASALSQDEAVDRVVKSLERLTSRTM